MQRRDALNTQARKVMNSRILEYFIQSEWYQQSSVLFTYLNSRSEVDTHAIVHYAWKDHREVLVPRTTNKKGMMEAVELNTMEQLVPGKFGLMEPEPSIPPTNPSIIDLILAPGLAFDRQGYRIGYGGGYYDRFMVNTPPPAKRVGLAYSFQISEDPLPRDHNDLKVDALLTEVGWLFFDR